jgi:hypothetical protein
MINLEYLANDFFSEDRKAYLKSKSLQQTAGEIYRYLAAAPRTQPFHKLVQVSRKLNLDQRQAERAVKYYKSMFHREFCGSKGGGSQNKKSDRGLWVAAKNAHTL